MTSTLTRRGLAPLALLPLAARPVRAQTGGFPSRVVTLMVPFAAGGSTDILARLLADSMSRDLGQQVIVENAPGAGGAIAAKRLLAASADGHTILIGNTGTLAAGVFFYRQKAYDPPTDFTALASVADAPQMLVAHKDVPVTDLDSFEEYARANEAKLNFGAAGIGSGSYLGAAIVNAGLGLKVQLVNYRSSGASLNDLLAGNVSFLVESTTGSLQHVRSGAVRGVAVLQKTRIPGAPDMKSAAESRFPNVEYKVWNVLVVRRGTPEPIVERLNASLRKAADDPVFKARTAELGLERPEESRLTIAGAQALLAEEAKRWQPLVASLGVTIE
jgi:tripartite-type tricarboxylate transporter receptor subunit TctC